jgi:hypothetical protein
MDSKKNNQTWEEHKNQNPENEVRGSKEQANDQQNPGNKLKDGTNDFQNGDQEPTSERSSDLKDQSPNA